MTFALSHRSLAQFWHNARLIEGAVNAQNELLRKDAIDSGCYTQFQKRPLPPQAASILASQPRIAPSADMKLSYRRTELQSFAQVHNLDMPLDLMVFSRAQRKMTPSSLCHLASTLISVPSLFEHEGIFVGIPELCALQVGGILSELDLVRYIYELCGGYTLEPTSPRGFLNCAPLTSATSCKDFVRVSKRAKGSSKLLRALSLVPTGHSASPRETALSMLLSLPSRLGGYGLNLTGLNVRIELGSAARGVYGKTSCVCDLLIGAIDIEYDSNAEHESTLSGVNDSLRSTALAFEGIEVVHVYAENLKTLDRLDSLATLISSKANQKLELDQSAESRRKREQLRRALLRPHSLLFPPSIGSETFQTIRGVK